MGCKVSKRYSSKQGMEEYMLLTCDFGSLQMRLTTNDTAIDSVDGKTPDAGLYEIYGEGSPCPDAHSATGKNTFVASIGGQTYELEMGDGTTVKLYQEMSAKVNRGGKEMTVKVKDLLPGDDFIEAVQDF